VIDKFKSFLAGAPNWIKDEGLREGWAYQVAVILPSVLRKWHDSDFGDDVWAMDGAYYEAARLKLVGLAGFKKNCAESGQVLLALKLLAQFFEDEKRKAARGTTTRGKFVIGGPGGVSGGTPGGRPLPAVEVLEEGEIKEMHISKHERNAALRKACIEHWRAQQGGKILCAACGMSFGERYGAVGEGYIEVHHLCPISQIEGVHAVDPKTDLVPLCANCHAMIHRLMTEEKKATGTELEGPAALTKLKEAYVGA